MLITDDFVCLNFPKTGTTFLRKMVTQAYEKKYPAFRYLKLLYKCGILHAPVADLELPNLHSPYPGARNLPGQHGTYSQIPVEHRHKPIVTICRNPYDLFISTYISKWWYSLLPDRTAYQQRFPNFPELTLNEYIELVKTTVDADPNLQVGSLSIQFIRMYFKEPGKVLAAMTNTYLESGIYKNDMDQHITFLRQENLNQELADFLETHGFDKTQTDFIRTHQKLNTGNFSGIELWTPEAIAYVETYERFLFSVLKNMGFVYKKPVAGSPLFKS